MTNVTKCYKKVTKVTYVQECPSYISIDNKKGYVVSLYRSPVQALDECDTTVDNLDKLLIFITKKQTLYWWFAIFNAIPQIGQLLIPQFQRKPS